MANANQVALGRSNLSTGTGYGGATDKYELYLKLFSGEMFKGFQHETIARAVSYTHLTLPTTPYV